VGERCGIQVVIVSHYPVGNSGAIISEAQWYEQLMIEFSDIVVLQIAGHLHADEFRLVEYDQIRLTAPFTKYLTIILS